jgi:hypothetical protein
MKKIALFIIAATFAACNGRKAADAATPGAPWRERPGSNRVFFGKWNAHRIQDSTAKEILVVTGTVELQQPNAKAVLMKADIHQPRYQQELVLMLTKRPRKTMDKPVTVGYTERIEGVNYKRVRIMYRRDTVALIYNIE